MPSVLHADPTARVRRHRHGAGRARWSRRDSPPPTDPSRPRGAARCVIGHPRGHHLL